MKSTHAFWWAAFGAVLPEVIRFFKIVSTGQQLPSLNWLLYIGLLVVFCVCAGLFSVAWKPENSFKAIWVGASLPTIVATLYQTAPSFLHT
ncbi:MAG TPA: hypothetical protein VE994_05315 [Terriglobales bacterium]|nr:hypothetical protein [Terriglobales bacterium]